MLPKVRLDKNRPSGGHKGRSLRSRKKSQLVQLVMEIGCDIAHNGIISKDVKAKIKTTLPSYSLAELCSVALYLHCCSLQANNLKKNV